MLRFRSDFAERVHEYSGIWPTQAVSSLAEEAGREADAGEARARLAASEAARKAEVAALERRVDGLEAELAAAQRQLEQAEAAAATMTVSGLVHVAGAAPAGAGQTAQPPSAASPAPAPGRGRGGPWPPERPASPEAFIAALRRERLVDLQDMEGAPESVRVGIAQLSKSLCAAVERLAEDLYESECHFVYELVQNAEDAHRRPRPGETGPATLRLALGPASSAAPSGYFVSESNEAGFADTDVAAICDVSASSKKKPSAGGKSIGCKGIGFKSVFTVSDRPHVLSRDFTFCFDVTGPMGKLGYVTPTWLGPSELAALPPGVREAHAAGRTVLYLPLKRPGLVAAIQREMDELAEQGRATLLFLESLERIELVPAELAPRRALRRVVGGTAGEVAVVVEADCAVTEHRYLLHRHRLSAAPGVPEEAAMVLAFPMPPSPAVHEDGADATSAGADTGGCGGPSCAAGSALRLEPIFCSLPVRSIGFGFAMHCATLDLVANRADFHHGSTANRAVRDALPDAFAAACAALPGVAARAVTLLGEPVADPFWRPAREGALDRLAAVACVATAAGPRKPTEVLLRGPGSLGEVADLLPTDLLLRSCGRAFAITTDATEERLLRRLGAEVFSLAHLCGCLAFTGDPWPQGWVASLWLGDSDGGAEAAQPGALVTVRALYRCLASAMLDGHHGKPPADGQSAPEQQLDAALAVPELPIFPLYGGGCARLSDGAVFRGFCIQVSCKCQQALSEAKALRVLPPPLVQSLDAGTLRLFEALGISLPSAADVAQAALQVQLRHSVEGEGPAPEGAQSAIWASLLALCEVWLRGDEGEDLQGQLEEALQRCGLGGAGLGLADVALLPSRSGRLHGPRHLVCPTLLGAESSLDQDILSRIGEFLAAPMGGAASAASEAAGVPARGLLGLAASAALGAETESVGLWPPLPFDTLRWEAFLVDGLLVQPWRPLDPRAQRVAPDLAMTLGRTLADDGPAGLWHAVVGTGSAGPAP